MPRYIIERQFLVPMFEHVFVEAPSLQEACRRAIDEHEEPWGDNSELDFDNSRPVTIAQAVELPDTLFPELQTSEDADHYVLNETLYGSGLELLQIPSKFAEPRPEEDDAGFV
jgi:hypothetical protein